MSSGGLFQSDRFEARLNYHGIIETAISTVRYVYKDATVQSKLQNLLSPSNSLVPTASPLILIQKIPSIHISFLNRVILALSSKSRLPLSRKGRERGEGDGYRGWGIREENSRAKAGARAISRRFSGARVSPRPGRATRCACARSIRCRSWRLIGRPLPDKSRSRSCRSERGRAAIRGLSARLFPRPPLQRRQSAYYHRLCLLFFPSLPPSNLHHCVAHLYISHTYIHFTYTRNISSRGSSERD